MRNTAFITPKDYKPRPRLKKKGIEELIKNRKPTLVGISKLMSEIRSFVKVVKIDKNDHNFLRKKDFVEKEYGARSAENLARRRKIIVPGKITDLISGQIQELWGCHQQSIVLCNALKKMGVSANTYRYKMGTSVPHTVVIFELNGKTYNADIYNYNISIINPDFFSIAKKVPAKPITYEEFKRQKRKGL